jgi:catechol 2,3-dioxygenase-like lactoylglutathione lyase family enzyme
MDITLSHTFITVHDMDAALGFYRDVLGLELTNDVAGGGFRWVTLVAPSQPELDIVLSEPGAGRSPEDGEALAALLAKGSLNGPIFTTPDVDTTFEKVRSSGAEVLQEPIDQPWGPRDCAFRDPSGNMVRINQKK